jgi:hypothetical protein
MDLSSKITWKLELEIPCPRGEKDFKVPKPYKGSIRLISSLVGLVNAPMGSLSYSLQYLSYALLGNAENVIPYGNLK